MKSCPHKGILLHGIGSQATPKTANLMAGGVAVLFDVNVSAAQSCGGEPAVFPSVRLRSAAGPKTPLDRL